jgi:DNA-binding winged helix-turn-helix (wHTH) protein/TolB-like protein/Tfp pilus assembly protein PilF
LSHSHFYAFGPFRLDPVGRVLRRDGALVPLPPKAVDLLVALVESAGEVVSKDDLMKRVWPDTFVEEGNLSVNIFTLRKTLGDETIRTIPKRGYSFVAPVTRAGPGVAAADEAAAPAPPTGARVSSSRLALVALLSGIIVVFTLSYVPTTREGPLTLPGRIQTVAVLPFSYAGLDPADEYLGPGFASAVANALAQQTQLIVRPMASTLKYGGAAQDPVEAGRGLSVAAVLRGSLRRDANQVHLDAELVRVDDGARLWDASLADGVAALPALERTVADAVAGALEPAVAGEPARRSRPRTVDPDAYLAYLKGLDASQFMTPRDVEAAVDAFARAADGDDSFADAYSALGAFLTLPLNVQPTMAKYERGVAAARRALELDDRLPEPHLVLGRAAVVYEWDWAGAEREFRQAIALAPYDAEAHFWSALLFGATGRHEEALAEIRFAQQIDPSSPRISLYAGMLLLMARRYDEAIAQFRKTPIETGVTSQQNSLGMAVAQVKNGRVDEALATLDRLAGVGRPVQTLPWNAHRAWVLAAAGRAAEAQPIFATIEQSPDRLRPQHAVIAAAYACAGRMDLAFDRLDRAIEERDSRVIFLNVDPMLDCARSDPRFPSRVERIRLDAR